MVSTNAPSFPGVFPIAVARLDLGRGEAAIQPRVIIANALSGECHLKLLKPVRKPSLGAGTVHGQPVARRC